MLEYYEPLLDLERPDLHNTLCVVLTLKEAVDGTVLKAVVERLRSRFPYFYVRAALNGQDVVVQPNPLAMTIRSSWEPILLNSEESGFHLASWKYEGNRVAFEVSHALTDGVGIIPYIKSAMYLYLSETTGRSFDYEGFRLPGDVIPESETGNPFNDNDIDAITAPFYEKKPITDFFRLVDDKTKIDKRVFFLKLSESQVMKYCRSHDGSPNAFISVMMARAARRYDPENEKTIVCSVAIDNKAMLGNTDNYKMFAGVANLDFPKDRDLNDISMACTIARIQLMMQAQPENSLWHLKQMKNGQRSVPTDVSLSTMFVSYVDCRSFGPLEPFIENLFILTSLQKLSDLLCEMTCINHSFFLAYMQPFSSDRYFKCFLRELEWSGIDYEVLGTEPLRLSGIEATVHSENSN